MFQKIFEFDYKLCESIEEIRVKHDAGFNGRKLFIKCEDNLAGLIRRVVKHNL